MSKFIFIFAIGFLSADIALANTMATVALPADVSAELAKIGFSGLSAWIIGIIALVAAVSAGFVIAGNIKRSVSMISEGKTWDEIQQDRALFAHLDELEKSSGGAESIDLDNPKFEYETK